MIYTQISKKLYATVSIDLLMKLLPLMHLIPYKGIICPNNNVKNSSGQCWEKWLKILKLTVPLAAFHVQASLVIQKTPKHINLILSHCSRTKLVLNSVDEVLHPNCRSSTIKTLHRLTNYRSDLHKYWAAVTKMVKNASGTVNITLLHIKISISNSP